MEVEDLTDIGLEAKALNLEQKTREFFEADLSTLWLKMKGLEIVIGEKRIRVDRAEAIGIGKSSRNEAGGIGAGLSILRPGDIGFFWHPSRESSGVYIGAVPGYWEDQACIRLQSVGIYKESGGKFVAFDASKKLAGYLRMKMGEVGKLKFVDDTDTLHVVPGKKIRSS